VAQDYLRTGEGSAVKVELLLVYTVLIRRKLTPPSGLGGLSRLGGSWIYVQCLATDREKTPGSATKQEILTFSVIGLRLRVLKPYHIT
jgi:hypothetical protein